MFGTTIIHKTITGIMQSAGGFAEPITRTLGLRVRTAAGNSVELSHNDTDGKIESSTGKLQLDASTDIEALKNLSAPKLEASAGGVWDGPIRIPSPSTGTTANRPIDPVLGQEYFDTDLDSWIKWNGSEWRYLTEASV